MKNLKLSQIAKYCSAELLQGDQNRIIEEIVIDSRKVKANHLFIAVIGENDDGHHYLKEAIKMGAAAVIVERIPEQIDLAQKTAVLKVKDTTKALQDIAHNYRVSFKNLKVIAVTGSAGKTTTKDLIYSVLSQKYSCLKTEGNYNNHIGLPLTLLNLSGREDFAVLEMGMSALGEIDLLAKIALPDYGVVTNVAAAHLKQLKSLENIARAKKELIDNLGAGDTAVLNFDNHFTARMALTTAADVIGFGFDSASDIQAVDYSFDREAELLKFKLRYQQKDYEFIYQQAGKHNIYNAMAAAVIAFKNSLTAAEIQKGLLKTEFSALRMEIIKLANGARIINDSYNANPLAVKAALDVLMEIKAGRKIALLASMLELGALSAQKHTEIGIYAAEKGIDLLVTTSAASNEAEKIAAGAKKKMSSEKIISFLDNQSTIDYLKKELRENDLLLVKGSRSNRLEEIVEALKINFSGSKK